MPPTLTHTLAVRIALMYAKPGHGAFMTIFFARIVVAGESHMKSPTSFPSVNFWESAQEYFPSLRVCPAFGSSAISLSTDRSIRRLARSVSFPKRVGSSTRLRSKRPGLTTPRPIPIRSTSFVMRSLNSFPVIMVIPFQGTLSVES